MLIVIFLWQELMEEALSTLVFSSLFLMWSLSCVNLFNRCTELCCFLLSILQAWLFIVCVQRINWRTKNQETVINPNNCIWISRDICSMLRHYKMQLITAGFQIHVSQNLKHYLWSLMYVETWLFNILLKLNCFILQYI
jgi:hypothetical protein